VEYFHGKSPYNSLSWSDVSTPAAQSLAYEAAVEGKGWDRSPIAWPGNPLDLVAALAKLGKPVVVV